MDFLHANSLLEGVQDDLEEGLFAEARQKLEEALASPEQARAFAKQRSALAKVKRKLVGVPEKGMKDLERSEDKPGQLISFQSVAQVEPKDQKKTPEGKPMRFTFKSIPKKGQIKADEAVKVKQQYFKQKYREKQQQGEGIFDRFIGGGKGAKKPNISDEPRRGPAPIPNRHAGKHSNKPFQPAVVGYGR